MLTRVIRVSTHSVVTECSQHPSRTLSSSSVLVSLLLTDCSTSVSFTGQTSLSMASTHSELTVCSEFPSGTVPTEFLSLCLPDCSISVSISALTSFSMASTHLELTCCSDFPSGTHEVITADVSIFVSDCTPSVSLIVQTLVSMLFTHSELETNSEISSRTRVSPLVDLLFCAFWEFSNSSPTSESTWYFLSTVLYNPVLPVSLKCDAFMLLTEQLSWNVSGPPHWSNGSFRCLAVICDSAFFNQVTSFEDLLLNLDAVAFECALNVLLLYVFKTLRDPMPWSSFTKWCSIFLQPSNPLVTSSPRVSASKLTLLCILR